MIKIFKELTIKSDNSICLKSVHVVNMKVFSKKIVDFNPEQNDVLYIPSGCNIPSAKLKNFVVSHSIRRTNNLERATTVVLGKENIYEYLKTEYYYILNRQDIIDHTLSVKEVQGVPVYENLVKILNEIDDEFILTGYSTLRQLENHLDFEDSYNTYKKFHTVRSDMLSTFENISELKMVSEASILKNINGEHSVEITQELYEQLCNMLTSSDDDNTTMAMEIMANCHYMKSLPYLFLLFEKYSFKFENSPVKRHVNFKSLLTMLNLTLSNIYMNIDHMIDVMIKYNQVTKEKLDFLLENLIEKYNIRLDSHSDHYIGYLEFSELSIPHEKLTEILGYTYTYKIPQNGSRAD